MRFRFELLITELSTSDVCQYEASLLGFINCLILGEPNLLQRCSLRNELIGLELLSILESLRESINDDVVLQLKAFQAAYFEDNQQLASIYPTGISHHDMFNSIFSKVKNSPNSYKLLSLLQYLDDMEYDRGPSDEIWNDIENLSLSTLNNRSKFLIKSKIKKKSEGTSVGTQTFNIQSQFSTGNVSDHSILLHKEYNNDISHPSILINSTRIQTRRQLANSTDIQISTLISNSTGIPSPPPLPNLSCISYPPAFPNSIGIPSPPPLPNSTCSPHPPPLPISPGIPSPPPVAYYIGTVNPISLPSSTEIPSPPPLPNSTSLLPPLLFPNSTDIPYPPPLPISKGIPFPPPLNYSTGILNPIPLPNSTEIPPPPPLPKSNSIPPPPPLPKSNFIPPPPPLPNSTCIRLSQPIPNSTGISAKFSKHSTNQPTVLTSFPTFNPLLSTAIVSLSGPVINQVLSSHIPKPSIKMKRVNWGKVNHQTISNSVWSEIITEFDNFVPKDVNYLEIEELFAQNTTMKKAVEPSKPKKAKESFLDSKTSLNLSIFLKQFKLQPEEVASCIRNVQVDRIDGDSLMGLLKILPEKNEVDGIRRYEGDITKLSPPDIFLYHVFKIPSVEALIKGMILKAEFEPSVSLINQSVTALLEICESVLCSLSIKLFLAHVLTLGNFLNTGSYAGNAVGFKLSTITKLWETRANKAGVTFLHYVIDRDMDHPTEMLDFVQELRTNLELTWRLSMDSMKVEFEELKGELKLTNKLVRTTAEEYLPHFQTFLTNARRDTEEMDEKFQQLENLRLKMATYFCEDESKFRIEDCLGIFNNLCNKVQLVMKENADRKKREEKRRKLEEQRKKEESSGKVVIKKGKMKSHMIAEESVIDNLLNEIKKGNFKLRTISPGSE